VLDADKEGFLRSATSLIQTMGRAARHLSGTVILYADAVTESMATAMRETQRRREIQEAFNRDHGITPQSIVKPLDEELVRACEADYVDLTRELTATKTCRTTDDLEREIAVTRRRMLEAAGGAARPDAGAAGAADGDAGRRGIGGGPFGRRPPVIDQLAGFWNSAGFRAGFSSSAWMAPLATFLPLKYVSLSRGMVRPASSTGLLKSWMNWPGSLLYLPA